MTQNLGINTHTSVHRLFTRYFPIIEQRCARILGDRAEAEDIAQETFARLWRNRNNIKDPQAIVAWIYRTSTRIAINRLRQTTRQTAVSRVELPFLGGRLGSDKTQSIDIQIYSRELLAAVRMMPTKELEVLLLARIDGLTQQQIVDVTRRSERTIRRLIVKADRRLSKIKKRSDTDDC